MLRVMHAVAGYFVDRVGFLRPRVAFPRPLVHPRRDMLDTGVHFRATYPTKRLRYLA